MAIHAWQRGRRLLTTASVLMILVAAAHTTGFLSRPTDPAEITLLGAMDALRTPLGLGMNPSVLDVFRALAFTMSVMLIALGVLNLVLASSADATPRLLRRVVWCNAAWIAGFLAVSLRYQVPPPLLSAIVIELVLIAALVWPAPREAR